MSLNRAHMQKSNLTILAGPTALAQIRERGLRPDDVDVFPGASGGPKWFVLTGLDRVIFGGFFAGRQRPLHLIGSSIGAWRTACLAQADPVSALERLTEGYLEQRYPAKPTAAQVSAEARKILDHVLGRSGAAEIVAHPWARLHIVAARCEGLAASEVPRLQLAGFLASALGNIVSRRTLGRRLERVIFHTAGDTSPFVALNDLPTRHVELREENVGPALLASGAIPLVLEGIPNIAGAPQGMYRDGGIVDYHFDIDFGAKDGLVLYPHFYPHLVPGWFDKPLRWRRARGEKLDRVVLVAPSREFVERLPYGKIPDRKDFEVLDDDSRLRYWRKVVAESERLGDEFLELQEKQALAGQARPLPA